MTKLNVATIAPPQPVAKARLMSKDELTKLIDTKYQRRAFIAADIKDYVNGLLLDKAFALSRILPKEVLEKVLGLRGTEAFADNIIEYASLITIDGKLIEPLAAQVEELFLVTHASEFVKVINGDGY